MPRRRLAGVCQLYYVRTSKPYGISCHEFAFVGLRQRRTSRGSPGGRKICRRPIGAAQGRPDAAARQGPLHRRFQPSGPSLCGDGSQPDRAWHHPRDRHRSRAQNAGRTRRLYRRGFERLRSAQMRRAVQQSRRLADEKAAAPGAADRQGALCRRPDRFRRRRNIARRPKMRPKPLWSTSRRYPP